MSSIPVSLNSPDHGISPDQLIRLRWTAARPSLPQARPSEPDDGVRIIGALRVRRRGRPIAEGSALPALGDLVARWPHPETG